MNKALSFIIGGIAITLISLLLLHGSAVASTTTTIDTQPGQVKTVNNNGTLYLSTQTTTSTQSGITTTTTTTVSTASATPNPDRPLDDVSVKVPHGFAQTFSGLLNGILSFVLVVAALLVFLFLLWGAFDWITSGGDKGKTDKARQKIISAIVGLIIVASSYAILTLVLRFLGFGSINDVFDAAGTINGGASQSAQIQTLQQLNEATPNPTPAAVLH